MDYQPGDRPALGAWHNPAARAGADEWMAHHRAERAARAMADGDVEAARVAGLVGDNGTAPKPDLDVDTFLNQPEPDYDWVIPGLIERGDRLILTGPEGGGKSTLMRQIAVQSSAGIHPFTLEPIDPVRVLLVDLENSRRHVRRELRPLRLAATELDPMFLRVRVKPDGINLGSALWQEWLEARLVANKVDLLVIGPVYKLADGDPTEEKVAKPVAMHLDRMRAEHNVALFLEAHQPYAQGGRRPERPYGASLWSRWPEFGLHLGGGGELHHWRGPRDEREWPVALKRGGEWPWTIETNPRTVTFALMLAHVSDHGGFTSNRALASALGTSESTIRRCIDANRPQWEATLQALQGGENEEF